MSKKFLKALTLIILPMLGNFTHSEYVMAMNDEEVQEKLTVVRQKIASYEPVQEYPWSETLTSRTEGILEAKIGGKAFPFCHASYLGITKLNSELIQGKCILKIPVDYIPYSPQRQQLGNSSTYDASNTTWFD